MNLKAIIIEDEESSRITLRNMIVNFCQGIDIVAEAASVSAGVKAIQKHRPDLVFLDIEMPEQNGFKLFDYFEQPNFHVIFTTAYDQYAVKAFRLSASDYLLKPIDLEDLRAAVVRVKNQTELSQSLQKLSVLRENLNNFYSKLALPTSQGYSFVELSQIIYCEAQGNYTQFYLRGNEKILVSKTLKIYDDLLQASNFFRISRSHLVNLNHVEKFGRQKSPTLTLSNGQTLNLSEGRRNDFLKKIDGL
ncbi:MAG: LytTR family DNA-binding domain-containing protein [Bacteroidota bacterium]